MTDTITASKQKARKQARWLRDSQFQTTLDHHNQAMLEHFKEWIARYNPQHIGLYAPIGQEAQTKNIFEFLISIKKTCWYPKVEGPTMTFFHVAQYEELNKGAFGILEPTRTEAAPKLDLLLVPALAMDAAGQRLGFGRGYYDQFIQSHSPKQTMAWIHTYQMRSQIPVEAHDQPLHWIATEKGIRRVL